MPIRNVRPMFKGQLALETQAFPSYGAVIGHEFSLEQVLDPGFWHTQNKTLVAGARIRCEWEDGSRVAVLRVMGVDANAREVLVVVESQAEFPAPPVPDGFTLEFVNRAVGWRILEEGRRAPRRTGFATAIAAAHWLIGDRGPSADQRGETREEPAKPAKPPKAVKPPAKEDAAPPPAA